MALCCAAFFIAVAVGGIMALLGCIRGTVTRGWAAPFGKACLLLVISGLGMALVTAIPGADAKSSDYAGIAGGIAAIAAIGPTAKRLIGTMFQFSNPDLHRILNPPKM